MRDLQLWGGLECTVNRVGDTISDQFQLTGHHDRPADLDALAELGVSAIRYPILWERVSPDRPDDCAWEWTDARLEQLRSLGIEVIAGLVHHGSGPRYTDLLSDDFAPGLARHARHVAERYPWIADWTPVNEPVTTARFSALYGHWYPHHRDEGSFWRAVVNQMDGVRLSMREIRRVNPAARLVQTDDLGRTYSTAALSDEADYHNLRRWAAWDLLCGRVTSDHPLFERVAGFGHEERLRAFADDPCPADVIGVNHYLTSDRFLDHRRARYPSRVHGADPRAGYVDVEAVRVLDPAVSSLEGALREAWDRYGVPLAITEVHNGCTREEQMRWIADAWDTAAALRAEGVAIEAVTPWALLGSSGWNTLLTMPGLKETGAYCLAGADPRPTALVGLLKGLPGGAPRHPVLAGQGWWRRPIRLIYPPVRSLPRLKERPRMSNPDVPTRPLLICGATGTLGQALAGACRHRDIPFVLTSRGELDLTDARQIGAVLDAHRPWAAVNAAGWVRVDDAEADPDACFAANTAGAALLGEACSARGIATAGFSSDLVFDGRAGRPYVETDTPTPLNVYGRSKAEAEAALSRLDGTHLIVRTAAFFSPFDEHNFAVAVVRSLSEGRRLRAACDQVVSPTYVPHLVRTTLDLLIDGADGIWHLTNGAAVSWAEFAEAIAAQCGLDERLIDGVPGAEMGWAAPRPAYVPLASIRGTLLPSFDEAVEAFGHEVGQQGSRALRAA